MQLKHLTRLILTALLVAWCFDQLFWRKAPGVSFFIMVLLWLAAGLFLTRSERLKPPRSSFLLLMPILLFAFLAFLRQEPFTQAVDILLSVLCLILLSMTWLGGRWWQYDLGDYLANGLHFLFDSLFSPIPLIADQRRRAAEAEGGSARMPLASRLRPFLSVLLGLLLALPVVTIMAVLLANADPVFNGQLQALFQYLRIEKLGEYLYRLSYIIILAYIFTGVLLVALLSSPKERIASNGALRLHPFLGWVEAVTVLVCVDLLFAFFVLIQFRYFFGGQANISLQGFTYSAYARRGFGELLAVAFLSLLLFLVLSWITRRQAGRSRRLFSALGILLVGLVAVILVSAFQRLLLYEAAYGFTRLRAYTHIFMFWLGVLLLATAVLEGFDRLRYFALGSFLVCLGFGLTLNLVNVDAFIVRQNIARLLQQHELDAAYLAGLSDDAVPALFESLHSGQPGMQAPFLHEAVGATLACQSIRSASAAPRPWQSFHLAHYRAELLFRRYQLEVQDFLPGACP
jgi:hypothetical protein